MRICDITRNDEVVGTVHIYYTEGDSQTATDTQEIEVGKPALDAFKAGAWGTLQLLTPAALRVKDAKKSAASKKAGQTRQANKAQKAAEAPQVAPGASETGTGGTTAPTPPTDPQAAPQNVPPTAGEL